MAGEAPTVALIPLRWMHKSPRYLLLLREGQWQFPAQTKIPTEQEVQCAKRAMLEATRMNALSFRWGHRHHKEESADGTRLYYVAENPFGEVQLLGQQQSGTLYYQEFRWFKYREARHHLPYAMRSALDWAHEMVIACPPESIHKHNVRSHVSLFCRRKKNRQPA